MAIRTQAEVEADMQSVAQDLETQYKIQRDQTLEEYAARSSKLNATSSIATLTARLDSLSAELVAVMRAEYDVTP